MTHADNSSLKPTFDHDLIRAQFPALHQIFESTPLCYLDTAATSQKPQSVIDAMNAYYQLDNANVHRAAHQLSARATVQYEKVREQVQGFINAKRSQEVIFTQGTTSAINMIAHGLHAQVNKDDVILIDTAAHHANIVPWQQLATRVGAIIKAIPLDQQQQIDVASFQQLVNQHRPKLVALAHVTNALGSHNPVEQLIEIAKAADAITVVDGAQAVAHLPVDVQQLDCDFYAFSGHKMYGPTGIGVLYGRFQILDTLVPMLTGGEMIKTVSFEHTEFGDLPNRLEAGTPPIAEVIGLGAAISFLQSLPKQQIREHEQALMQYLQQQLIELGDIELYGIVSTADVSKSNIGAVAFNIKGEHHQDVGILLDQQGIAIRCGHHCAMPLMQHLAIKGCCRVSIGVYTNKQDIDCFINALKEVKSILL
ncbi:aminotransferase class V-fold PLP-dependent enzyme [Shewanella maritima]|uniref:aminotransferase class V-fold PLP-dependent enzyme n=1 Tax=Shewanella maritima TaxID=2520507 RepID=UPI003736704A